MNDETRIASQDFLKPSPERKDGSETDSPLRAFSLRLMQGKHLLSHEAADFLDALLDAKATDAQIAAALVVQRGKNSPAWLL